MRNICVFLGANIGEGDKYTDSVVNLAKQIVQRNFGLVYGGASVGLMGRLANTVLAENGVVTGVIPKSLLNQEIAHQSLSKLHVVDTIQRRKTMMADLSHAFISFPGGLGTLEETFEVWNAIKIGLHKKPLGLLNVDGFFDPLLNFISHSVKEGFVKQNQADLLIVSGSPTFLLDRISSEINDTETFCEKIL